MDQIDTTVEDASQNKRFREDVCLCKTTGRNLVVCIDGTSNQFGPKNTNVVELYSRLYKDDKQLTFYNSGIGTYATPSWKSPSYIKQVIYNSMDLAFAWRFEKILLDAYRWLSEMYKPHDRIFLFGFSRGAYQIRALAAMIETVGLIHRGNGAQIPFAYELYRHTSKPPKGRKMRAGSHPEEPPVEVKEDEDSRDPHLMALRFKQSFSRENVKVHFVGAWDTVSSVGLVRERNLPLTADGMKHVCYFRHALALNERRVKFLPEYAYGGVSVPPDIDEKEGYLSIPKQKKTSSTLIDRAFGEKVLSGYALICENCYQHNGLVEENELNKKYRCPGCRHVNSPDLSETVAPSPSRPVSPIGNNQFPAADSVSIMGSILTSTAVHTQAQGEGEYSSADKNESPLTSRRPGQRLSKELHTKEVWFSGTHSDIGGGRIQNANLNSYGHALQWMMHEAMLAGLLVRPPQSKLREKDTQKRHGESLTLVWWPIELLPVKRSSYKSRDGTTHVPHIGRRRQIAEGQLIHGSVWAKVKNGKTKARIPPHYWKKHADKETIADSLDSGGISKQSNITLAEAVDEIWVEPDISDEISNFITQLRKDPTFTDSSGSIAILKVLDESSFTPSGQLSLGEVDNSAGVLFDLFCNLHSSEAPEHDQREASRLIMSILLNFASESFAFYRLPAAMQLMIANSAYSTLDDMSLAKRFLTQFRTAEVKRVQCTGPNSSSATVLCVAFSSNDTGTHEVVCGLSDGTVRVWDTATDDVALKTSQRHKKGVLCIAFSSDGKRIASGSGDHTVRVWDARSGEMCFEPLKHDDSVSAIAFSPSCTRIASGSHDRSVILWNAKTGRQVHEMIHQGSVYSVAFSADGKRLASGSSDWTICIWNTATGRACLEPLKGHTRSVVSVVFSSNGERIVSGSYDNTVRLWDAKTGEVIFQLTGHSDDVTTVAFSPEDKLIASGSDDSTIRIWDANTGKQILPSFKHAGGWVRSVAFSADGRFLVSGTDEGQIHMWDITGERFSDPIRSAIAELQLE